MRLEADGIKHGARRRAVRAVNQNARMRTQRILFHRTGSVAEKNGARARREKVAHCVPPAGGPPQGVGRPAEHETRLLQTNFLANVSRMSTVELAVRKVKKLSARQARELLGWLTAQQADGTSLKQPSRISRRKTTARRSMQKLKAWQDSIRFTTNWQPPRMPDDLVKPVRL